MNAQLPVVQKAALIAGNRPVAIVPQSIEEVWRFAEVVAKSGMAPKGMERPEMITVAIMHGLEIGLTPLMALQRIAIINGRPTLWGDGAMALVKSSGLCDFISENIVGNGDTMHALCTVKRTGEPDEVSRTFSVEDAKKAGLWGKSGPWQQYPKRMLQMRARAFALRDVFADVLGGMYLREEMDNGDIKDVTPAAEPPTPPEPPAIEAKKIENHAGEAPRAGTAAAPKRDMEASVSGRDQPAPEPYFDPETGECWPELTGDKKAAPKPPNPPGTDALGGKPDTDAIPPGLRRATKPKEAPPFKLDAWLNTLAIECLDKTPAQLLDLRVKMIEPLRERLGHDGYNRAGDVLGAAMEVAQKKYAPKPAFDADQWYRDLEGAISGCTTAAQVFEIQEKVQKPALELVSREHYAKGKKLVQAALIQLSDED